MSYPHAASGVPPPNAPISGPKVNAARNDSRTMFDILHWSNAIPAETMARSGIVPGSSPRKSTFRLGTTRASGVPTSITSADFTNPNSAPQPSLHPHYHHVPPQQQQQQQQLPVPTSSSSSSLSAYQPTQVPMLQQHPQAAGVPSNDSQARGYGQGDLYEQLRQYQQQYQQQYHQQLLLQQQRQQLQQQAQPQQQYVVPRYAPAAFDESTSSHPPSISAFVPAYLPVHTTQAASEPSLPAPATAPALASAPAAVGSSSVPSKARLATARRQSHVEQSHVEQSRRRDGADATTAGAATQAKDETKTADDATQSASTNSQSTSSSSGAGTGAGAGAGAGGPVRAVARPHDSAKSLVEADEDRQERSLESHLRKGYTDAELSELEQADPLLYLRVKKLLELREEALSTRDIRENQELIARRAELRRRKLKAVEKIREIQRRKHAETSLVHVTAAPVAPSRGGNVVVASTRGQSDTAVAWLTQRPPFHTFGVGNKTQVTDNPQSYMASYNIAAELPPNRPGLRQVLPSVRRKYRERVRRDLEDEKVLQMLIEPRLKLAKQAEAARKKKAASNNAGGIIAGGVDESFCCSGSGKKDTTSGSKATSTASSTGSGNSSASASGSSSRSSSSNVHSGVSFTAMSAPVVANTHVPSTTLPAPAATPVTFSVPPLKHVARPSTAKASSSSASTSGAAAAVGGSGARASLRRVATGAARVKSAGTSAATSSTTSNNSNSNSNYQPPAPASAPPPAPAPAPAPGPEVFVPYPQLGGSTSSAVAGGVVPPVPFPAYQYQWNSNPAVAPPPPASAPMDAYAPLPGQQARAAPPPRTFTTTTTTTTAPTCTAVAAPLTVSTGRLEAGFVPRVFPSPLAQPTLHAPVRARAAHTSTSPPYASHEGLEPVSHRHAMIGATTSSLTSARQIPVEYLPPAGITSDSLPAMRAREAWAIADASDVCALHSSAAAASVVNGGVWAF